MEIGAGGQPTQLPAHWSPRRPVYFEDFFCWFWALITFFTIFCSSMRKARMIL